MDMHGKWAGGMDISVIWEDRTYCNDKFPRGVPRQ